MTTARRLIARDQQQVPTGRETAYALPRHQDREHFRHVERKIDGQTCLAQTSGRDRSSAGARPERADAAHEQSVLEPRTALS